MKKIAADRNYRMMKIAENTALSENAILSNNRITMIRISLLSMGIKEILGLMGVIGAAFGLGKWGGWIKDKWDSLTGKEKEDAGDQEIVQNLIASLSAEELEALYYEILAHREIEELVDGESIAPKGVSSRLESVMREISDKFETEIIENDQDGSFMLDEKKIAADRNYRITKNALSDVSVWRMIFKMHDGDANPEYTLGTFSSRESGMNSLSEVFKFAKDKGFRVEVEENPGSTWLMIGESEYYLTEESLDDGIKMKPETFHLYEDSQSIKEDEEDYGDLSL
jgi:uncharacterized pyridoxamine 5'-phosphate oxidase family protein